MFLSFLFFFLSLCDEDTTIDGILKRREEGIISNFELVYEERLRGKKEKEKTGRNRVNESLISFIFFVW